MAAIDVMPFDTSDYLADTGHLSLLQHGAYFLILLAMWRAGGWLADDEKLLMRICKTTPDKWRHIKADVRALLFSRDGKLSQKRLLAEYEAESRRRARLKGNFEAAAGEAQILASSKLMSIPDSCFDANALKTNKATSPFADSVANAPSLLLTEGIDSQDRKKVRERPSRYSRGRRAMMLEDWTPSERGLLYAKSKDFDDAKITQMARACLLYHRKHGTLIADLEATWASWVDREIAFAANKPNGGGSGRNGKITMTDIAMGRAG